MGVIRRAFFGKKTESVARGLIGKKLVREFDGMRLSGMVSETEAYLGEKDSACHSSKGKTHRNSVMYGPPGTAYVYFVYGMHFLLNVVTEREGIPCAVLIRGLIPLEGREHMEELRGRKGKNLSDGPAKLCQAMSVDKSLNQWDLTMGERLWFEHHRKIPHERIGTGPRIGVNYAMPEDRDAPLRFWLKV